MVAIYIRPVNARVNDQVRQNHSIQYYSYTVYRLDRLRKITPERYEFYTDMGMNKWIKLRIEIKNAQAKLFVEFSEDAYKRAAEPKELHIIPNAGHVDLYDRIELISFDKLTSFFNKHLK